MKAIFRFLVTAAGICLLPLVFSQSPAIPDSLQTRVGDFLKKGKYGEALALLEPAMEAARQNRDWERYGFCVEKTAHAFHGRNEEETALQKLETALVTLTDAGQSETVTSARLYSWKANMLRQQQRFAKSLEAYETAIRLFEKNHFQGQQLVYAYRNAAQIYMRHSNNRQAIKLLAAALRLDTAGTQHPLIYSQFSAAYFFLDSLPEAQRYYAAGMACDSISPDQAALLASAGAAIALRENALELAERRTLAALHYYQSQKTKIDNSLRACTDLADIAARRGRRTEAEDWYRRAEGFGKAYPGKSREMAILYLAWGGFWEKAGAPEKALDFYQKAIVQVFPGFNDPDVASNPPLSAAYIESQAMFALASKGAALLKKKSVTLADRANAADCFELSFAVAAQLRQTYGDDADKLTLAGENRAYQRLAARNLWQLWQVRREPATLGRLLALQEQSKAQALADAVRQQSALAAAGIPDSLLARETTLRLAAAEAALWLVSARLDDQARDSLQLVRRQEESFRADRAYAVFLDDLEKQHPRFRRFRAVAPMADADGLRRALPDSTALLSWFDAGDRYLCVVVRPAGLSAFETPRDSASDRQLRDFLRMLADRPAQENASEAYFAAAFALGSKLVPPAVRTGAGSLVIVPDGALSYLPFEALLTAPYQGSYGAAPYVLRYHTVRYAWSAALLNAPEANTTAGKGFLHVAPFVDATRDGLAPLPDSRRERLDGIEGDALTGPGATAEVFLREAPQYHVLQLSTHAHAGSEAVPGIELFDRTLLLPEIYVQRFPASLVVLSACETGAGRYADGEGVLSLARAFAYAGARSLLASHWSVNERSTAELFRVFYENIQRGKSKSEALRQAKLACLASAEMDVRKAPYYWAAFTLTGADGQVGLDEARWSRWPYWTGGLGLAVWGLWFFRKRSFK